MVYYFCEYFLFVSFISSHTHFLSANLYLTFQFHFFYFSRPYYETRANSFGHLNEQKQRIQLLEAKVAETKLNYNDTLRCLELISEEIHKMREDKYLIQTQHELAEFHHARSNKVDYTDEYMDFPSSTVVTPQSPDDSDDTNSDTFRSQGYSHISNNEQEKWTEIILTDPYSSTSDDHNHRCDVDGLIKTPNDSDDIDEDGCDGATPLVVIGATPDGGDESKDRTSISNWITKTNLKNKDRRQSLDILYDASDRVKDAFQLGFQKVGRTLERRNSESEASMDFFMFSTGNSKNEQLTDEQVENLQLGKDIGTVYEEFSSLTK